MPVLPEVGSMMTEPGFSCVVDHGAGHAVLDRTGGIEVFELGENLCLQVKFLFNVGKLQKRRLADELICGCIDMRHDDTSKIFRIEKI